MRERVLLVLALVSLAIWSGYNYGWLRYLAFAENINSEHQRVLADSERLELLRSQLYELHREGMVLEESNFEVTVRQVLAEYASATQLNFSMQDETEIYQMRWRGNNPDRFLAGLQKLGQLGGSTRVLRLRRSRGDQSEAYAEVHKR